MVSINALSFIDQVDIATIVILLISQKDKGLRAHLIEAEMPTIKPDVLIIESTYGVNLHEPREEREKRFTNTTRPDPDVRAESCAGAAAHPGRVLFAAP